MEFILGILCFIVFVCWVFTGGDDNDPTDTGEPVDYSAIAVMSTNAT